jgi:uncharacterized protein YaaQ
MKLIVAIVRDEDASRLSDGLVAAEYRVTRIATTGGFMKRGNTTLLVGVEDQAVDQAIENMKRTLGPRPAGADRRATVFVLDASKFEQV